MEAMSKRQQIRLQNEIMVVQFAKEAKTLYDIGVGPKTEWRVIKDKIPSLTLVGCEPHPEMYYSLLNEFPGNLFPVAISNKMGEETLYLHEDQKQTSTFDIGFSKPHKVECWTLDKFDEEAGKAEDIILWMDIEGSELKALVGADALLSSGRVLAINLEVRAIPKAEGWPTDLEIESFLNRYKYRVSKKYNNQGTHYDVIYTRDK